MPEKLNKNISLLFSFVAHLIVLASFYFIGLYSPSNGGNGFIEVGIEGAAGGGGSTAVESEEKINPDKTVAEDKIANTPKKIGSNVKAESQQNTTGSGGTGTGTGSGGTGTGTGSGGGLNLGLPAPPKPKVDDVYLVAVDEMPEPIGGIDKIVSSLRYPSGTKRGGGTVFVLAFIDENGTVRKTLLTKGLGSGYDEAALRAVSSTRFKPGKDHGKYVKVQVQIPVPVNFN
jgi:TonB family protein